jgi:hypothetical protein
MTASAQAVEAAISAVRSQFGALGFSIRDRGYVVAVRSAFVQTRKERGISGVCEYVLSHSTSGAHDERGAQPGCSRPRRDVDGPPRRGITLQAQPIGEPIVDLSNEHSTSGSASIGGQW